MAKPSTPDDEITAQRRAALRTLVVNAGGPAEFSRRYNLDANYIGQIINGHCAFSEKSRTRVELSMGLRAGTLDETENAVREPPAFYRVTIPGDSGAAGSIGRIVELLNVAIARGLDLKFLTILEMLIVRETSTLPPRQTDLKS